MTKAIFTAAKDFGLFRNLTAFAAGTALTVSIIAGGLLLSGGAFAQSNPEACVESCKKEQATCIDQQITKELCTHEFNVCEKECAKK